MPHTTRTAGAHGASQSWPRSLIRRGSHPTLCYQELGVRFRWWQMGGEETSHSRGGVSSGCPLDTADVRHVGVGTGMQRTRAVHCGTSTLRRSEYRAETRKLHDPYTLPSLSLSCRRPYNDGTSQCSVSAKRRLQVPSSRPSSTDTRERACRTVVCSSTISGDKGAPRANTLAGSPMQRIIAGARRRR